MKLNFLTIYIVLLSFWSLSVQGGINDPREFKVINAANDLADNSAQLVTCTKTGRMIISTIGNLNFYDGTRFSHIDTRPEYLFSIPSYQGTYQMFFDHYHHLWLKNKEVVSCVDLMRERFVTDPERLIREEYGCQEAIADLFVDSTGEVWLLTDKGLFCSQNKQTYTVMSDRNLQHVDVHGDILFMVYDNGEEVGLSIETGKVVHRTKLYEWDEVQKYKGTSIAMPYEDGYFLIRNGEHSSLLLYFDLKECKCTRLLELDGHLNSMTLHDGCLYMAADLGYWVYDIKTGEKQHVEELKLIRSGKTVRVSCNTMTFDKQGGMWIGTERYGLLYARPVLSPFKTYDANSPEGRHYVSMMEAMDDYVGDFKGMPTNFIFRDSRGWSWIGTTMGLYMYRTAQSEPVVFNRSTGLLNNVIHSIVEDREHNIWVSTSFGISCILFEHEKMVLVNSFNDEDNVPNESFVNGKAVCLDDGTIVMQGIEHVVVFHPDDFTLVNNRKFSYFYPKLTRLLVNGNFVEPGEPIDGNVVIDRAVTRVKEISLDANQNSISLTFSALNYFRPIQTYYRVRVTGIDDEWRVYSYFNSSGFVDNQGKLHLPLIGLQPGEYRVYVQASLFPDVWPDDKPYEWIIRVHQPWWRTTGVYAVLLFGILVMLGVNFYLYNKNTRMRAHRMNEEGDVIRKILAFVNRYESFSNALLSPDREEVVGGIQDSRNQLSPQFVELMLKLVPYIQKHRRSDLSMSQLARVGEVSIIQLFDIVNGHLYKNPRELSRIIRLKEAARLLRETDKSVEEIADMCKFHTPNFFMGNFFHEYKATPNEYRQDHAG